MSWQLVGSLEELVGPEGCRSLVFARLACQPEADSLRPYELQAYQPASGHWAYQPAGCGLVKLLSAAWGRLLALGNHAGFDLGRAGFDWVSCVLLVA